MTPNSIFRVVPFNPLLLFLSVSHLHLGEYRIITDRFKGIYRIYLSFIKGNRRMSTCNNRLDLQALGYQPVIMPKNLPDQCT